MPWSVDGALRPTGFTFTPPVWVFVRVHYRTTSCWGRITLTATSPATKVFKSMCCSFPTNNCSTGKVPNHTRTTWYRTNKKTYLPSEPNTWADAPAAHQYSTTRTGFLDVVKIKVPTGMSKCRRAFPTYICFWTCNDTLRPTKRFWSDDMYAFTVSVVYKSDVCRTVCG